MYESQSVSTMDGLFLEGFMRGAASEPVLIDPAYQEVMAKLHKRHVKAQTSLLEAFQDISDTFVDPNEACLGPDGDLWAKLDTNISGHVLGVSTAEGVKAMRTAGRHLAMTNEFAIGGHENRINYIIGSGHDYEVIAKPDEKVPKEALKKAQAAIDRFLKENKWHRRQQEIRLRKDRDGECFLRFFLQAQTTDEDDPEEGTVLVRFVEPGQVVTPQDKQEEENHSLGIITSKDDVETIEAYWIDGKQVDAKEIQHRKANVDMTVKRGVPLFYPVRKNLVRVEKLLRNMGVVASIQAAIAMIRKQAGITSDTATAWTQAQANFSVAHGDQPTTYHRNYPPGTILDAPSTTEYEFPSNGIDASKFVIVVQAELRAVASRVVMPEFMFTSDASNANYSSTLVSEGPAVKMIERLQATTIEEDKEVMDRVLDLAVESGKISAENREKMEVDVTPPTVASRDRLQETQADAILLDKKVMSIETMQIRNDLDPESETEKIDAQREKMGPFGDMDLSAIMGQGNTQPNPPPGVGREEEDD